MHGEIDSRVVERGGIKYRVDIEPDYESSTNDDDGLSPSDIAAFKAGSWRYVGMIVTPILPTFGSVDGLNASLWGIAYGTMPAETEPHQGGIHGEHVMGTDELLADDDYYSDLFDQARKQLAGLKHALTELLGGS